MIRLTFEGPAHESDDLQTQLEELIGAVYAAEANWNFDDRIDLGLGTPPEARRDRSVDS